MPKAELHLHLEGATPWPRIREALQRHHGITLPTIPQFYAPEFRFANFAQFVECFRDYIYPWIQTERGYGEVMEAVVDSLVEQRIPYVELMVNVITIEKLNLNLEKVLELLEPGIGRGGDRGTTIRLIAGISREYGSDLTVRAVPRVVNSPMIAGVDLQGAETPHTRGDRFRDTFTLARDAGKKIKGICRRNGRTGEHPRWGGSTRRLPNRSRHLCHSGSARGGSLSASPGFGRNLSDF
jgi:adenosine deaminase